MLRELAQAYRLKGVPDRALDFLSKAMEGRPDDLALLIDRGSLYSELGRYDQAVADLSRALRVKPDDPRVWKARGNVHARLGHPDESAADLARAMTYLNIPYDGSFWNLIDPSGTYSSAASDPDLFERVVRLRPDDIRLYRMRCEILARRRDWRQVADLLARLGKVAPDDQFNGHVEAIVRAWIGDDEGYRRICREMRARFGTTTNLMIARRVIQTCLLLPDELPDLHALKSLRDRLGFDPAKPSDAFTHWTEGLYLTRDGRPGAALEAYRPVEASIIYPTILAQFHVVKAIAYQRSGLPTEARRELDETRRLVEASKFDPRHEGLYHDSWHDWMRIQILLREAEALILHDPIFPANPFAR